MATDAPKIIQITACMTRGDKRDFANVYGLDEFSRVWQWNATDAKWRPFKIEAPAKGSDRRGGF